VSGKQLRDTEIEQLHLATSRHQDVRWLEVAMDHQVPMSELDGLADGQEEPETFLEVQAPRLTVAVDRLALDVLHREPW
jgi:myo-inositol catabolism protein IolC